MATHNRGDRVGAWLLGVFLWRERWVWFEQIEGVNKIPLKIFITSLLKKNGSCIWRNVFPKCDRNYRKIVG